MSSGNSHRTTASGSSPAHPTTTSATNSTPSACCPYFDNALICSDQHGAAKPAPSIFLAGCTALGLPPREVAYVGDKYTLDAVRAHDAGLHAYWLDRANSNSGNAANGSIRVIRSLRELPDALTR
ncbi:HAD family hydrolase [Streptomyces sp. AC555_RSS877]|uniref:HAD family hydrolase n=1 Tax=Streptomyces sp. AC555_RSS877 TaxID=2823688 RepID=UPI001C25C500|nr:HAD family hydrolase [Streptomyces sp. AC555_RSS877]